MKRSLKSFIGYTMGATDGEIGNVKEFYFDDKTWTLRYLIVETGNWLSGRKVLISTAALLLVEWEKRTFPINLSKEQIKNSPDIDTELPVSRQEEINLYKHYSWNGYWDFNFYGGGIPESMYPIIHSEDDIDADIEINGNPHLRSSHKVTGYGIEGTDGSIGDVEDFIIDDSSWKINFLVVNTGRLLPGKKVLISPKWIKQIDWRTSTVYVTLSLDKVRTSPEYEPEEPINEVYELNLHDYYGELLSH